LTNKEKIARLQPFVSDHKRELIERISRLRTRHITLAFEDIDKPHNISAVLRTAECLGIQDLHFIKNKNEYRINSDITKGAAKWLTLHHHKSSEVGTENIDEAFDKLRKDGYQIYATAVDASAKSIYDIPTDKKVAIVFGSEGTGISEDTKQRVDGLVTIPMDGFTESFNLSVSAAIILTVLMVEPKPEWYLNDADREALIADWYRNVVREADKILALK
jgi:tRNA (guanosine-2'-O-)-methyltransferase